MIIEDFTLGHANVTLYNASAYEFLEIVNGSSLEGPIFATAYFIPYCRFSKPKSGNIFNYKK